MNFLQAFQINTPTVVSEIFDDEVVIINMDSGSYYSLDQSGAALWQQLQQGATIAELIAGVAKAYVVNPNEITPAVQQFVAELEQEQLIVSMHTPGHFMNGALPEAISAVEGTGHSHFAPPVLTKFTDMQDLLLLDPIHDVDNSGWPAKK